MVTIGFEKITYSTSESSGNATVRVLVMGGVTLERTVVVDLVDMGNSATGIYKLPISHYLSLILSLTHTHTAPGDYRIAGNFRKGKISEKFVTLYCVKYSEVYNFRTVLARCIAHAPNDLVGKKFGG